MFAPTALKKERRSNAAEEALGGCRGNQLDNSPALRWCQEFALACTLDLWMLHSTARFSKEENEFLM